MATHDLKAPRRTVAWSGHWLTAIRWTGAVVFVVFGVGKFVNHASELASFRSYSLPAPEVFVFAIGILEVVGGLLLAARRLLAPAAVALGLDMVGAIVVSGLARGELISLTVAPALLLAMVALLRAEPGGMWPRALARRSGGSR